MNFVKSGLDIKQVTEFQHYNIFGVQLGNIFYVRQEIHFPHAYAFKVLGGTI